MNHKGQPTVILAKTVKGFGLGKAAEGQMVAHQQKKLDEEALRAVRDRFNIPLTDEQVGKLALMKPADDCAGDEIPARAPPGARWLSTRAQDRGEAAGHSGALRVQRACSKARATARSRTTMAFVRILTMLLKDKNIGKNIVPIVPDEARTFGMEGLFRQIGIYSSAGQLYTPVDSDQLMYYKEDKKGQMLEEGINEAGSTCSWIAAGTAYANHGIHMVPFYIYYSMFGFQRVGDFYWAAGDLRTRGFLLGATAGRTTLAGEGLQHQDGHSLLHAATVPNCVAYDPTYAYELAVIIQDGMKRMFANDESVFYYIAVMNENYVQPALPKGVEEGILKGMYLLQTGRRRQGARHADGLGHDPARSHRGGGHPRARTSAFRRTSTRRPASRSCAARRSRSNAGTACIRAKRRACRTSRRRCRRPRGRSSPPPTTCAPGPT